MVMRRNYCRIGIRNPPSKRLSRHGLVRPPPLAPRSFIYAFSSYLAKESRLFTRLKEPASRGLVFTNSGTSSIATVISYLSGVRIRRLHIINPAYHAVEALAKGYGIATSFNSIVRDEGCYALPKGVTVGEDEALWLTSPIYGASCYLDAVRVGHVIDALPALGHCHSR